MKFSGLTKKGRAYLAKCQAASTPIQFTKMKFGDGKLIDNENPADLTDIKNIKIEKSILSKEQKGDAVVLTTIIDNVSLEQGYFPRETGIYVLDEGVEVLYFYMNDGDETSWIPPEADGPHRMEVKINLISSNTGSVVVHNDGKDLYITKEYLEANYTQKGEYDGTAQSIEDRVVAAVGKEDGKFPLTEAIQGNVYYFSGNKKFYICKETQNRRISVPNEKFEELSIYENRKKLENLITFEENISLKVKVINVVLPPSTPIGQSISAAGIPKNTVYITGFLFNYIKEDATNIYDYWDLQISLPSNCIVKKKKEYNITGYATVLAFYK